MLKGWFVHQGATTPGPRVQGRRSQTVRSNPRWATDVVHVSRGQDGWAHLAAVIDGHDRELIGHEFALPGRAKEAERALEKAYLDWFGTLRPTGTHAGHPLRQWPDLSEPAFPGGVPGPSVRPGVHHSLEESGDST